MPRGKVLDPSAACGDDIADHGPDVGDVAGKRIGFRVDRIWRCWDWISEEWANRLQIAGAEVSFWRSTDRSGAEGERAAKELNEWLKTIDVAIVGLANCGACTGWTVRDSLTAASTGIPTMAIATENFAVFAKEIAARGGRSGLRVHVLPYPLNERERDEVMAVADQYYEPMLKAIGATIDVREAAE